MRTSNETTRNLMAVAAQLGGVYEGVNGTGHHLFRFDNGSTCRISGSPSEYRGIKNAQLEMERVSGRKLPRAKSGRSHKNFSMPRSTPSVSEQEQSDRHAALHAEIDAAVKAVMDEWAEVIAAPCRRNRNRAAELVEQWQALSGRCESLFMPPLPALPVAAESRP